MNLLHNKATVFSHTNPFKEMKEIVKCGPPAPGERLILYEYKGNDTVFTVITTYIDGSCGIEAHGKNILDVTDADRVGGIKTDSESNVTHVSVLCYVPEDIEEFYTYGSTAMFPVSNPAKPEEYPDEWEIERDEAEY